MQWLKRLNQKGAMFGLDARIAMVAMGVLASAIGIMSLSHVGEGKIYLATKRVEDLRRSMLAYLSESYSSPITDATDVYANFASDYADEELGVDPWGNNYIINRVTLPITLMGESVSLYLYTVHSAGPDGANDSATISNQLTYNSWVAQNDDIGLKFTTYDFLLEALKKSQADLQDISSKLSLYEARIMTTLRTFCDVPGNQLSSTCNFDGDGVYTTDEEFKTNLFPRSTGENTATKYYASSPTYTSGNQTSMQNLVVLLGFTAPRAQLIIRDPLQRTLRYHSNTTGAAAAPFAARVWYQ